MPAEYRTPVDEIEIEHHFNRAAESGLPRLGTGSVPGRNGTPSP
jgi:hypothetical protein